MDFRSVSGACNRSLQAFHYSSVWQAGEMDAQAPAADHAEKARHPNVVAPVHLPTLFFFFASNACDASYRWVGRWCLSEGN